MSEHELDLADVVQHAHAPRSIEDHAAATILQMQMEGQFPQLTVQECLGLQNMSPQPTTPRHARHHPPAR